VAQRGTGRDQSLMRQQVAALGDVPIATHLGNVLLRSMRKCVTWPAVLDPIKAAWILLCFGVLKRRFMRDYSPSIRASYGFGLAGSPVSSMLNRIIFYRGTFEPALSNVIDKLVREDDVCLDAGANVGYFTLLFAHKVGPGGRVIAIEASHGNVGKLHCNIAENKYAERVHVVHAACSDFSGQSTFYVHRKNDMHCRLQLPQKTERDYWLMGRNSWRSIAVEVKTIAQTLGDNAALVTFAKLDIEGAEHLICQQLIELCTHHRLVVALEAKAPHVRQTLVPFEQAGFLVYNLRNDYRWLVNTHTAQPTPETYENLYAQQHMVDVLLSRQALRFLPDGSVKVD
jgi:FkbM family methyltransferase